MFHLPAPSQALDRFRAPPSKFDKVGVSPLQPRLLKLLQSRDFGGHSSVTLGDLEGIGILLRRMKEPIPADATPDQRKERTRPHLGDTIAGCVVQVRPMQPVRATHHHALHILYCATAFVEEDTGFMRFLILGQVKFMACQTDRHKLQANRACDLNISCSLLVSLLHLCQLAFTTSMQASTPSS